MLDMRRSEKRREREKERGKNEGEKKARDIVPPCFCCAECLSYTVLRAMLTVEACFPCILLT